MLNKIFLSKLDKEKYVIWWSTAIKKQVSDFRKTNDLDIMCNLDFYCYIRSLEYKFKIKFTESHYAEYWIFILNFEDWTKIDVIIYNNMNNLKTKLIDWYYFLDILSIIWYKMNLVNNDLDKNLNKNNKHLKDIFWLYENYLPFTAIL